MILLLVPKQAWPAGSWTVGVSTCGNLVGLSEDEWNVLSTEEQAEKRAKAEATLKAAGAHYVIDSVTDLPAVLEDIKKREDKPVITV